MAAAGETDDEQTHRTHRHNANQIRFIDIVIYSDIMHHIVTCVSHRTKFQFLAMLINAAYIGFMGHSRLGHGLRMFGGLAVL